MSTFLLRRPWCSAKPADEIDRAGITAFERQRLCGDRLLAEQDRQDAKASIDRTVSLPPASSCACPAEHGAGGDGPQRTLFGRCESIPVARASAWTLGARGWLHSSQTCLFPQGACLTTTVLAGEKGAQWKQTKNK